MAEVLRRRPRFDRIQAPRVDEPESRANAGYELLEALRDTVGGLLLLTATPMQLHDYELYSMIELVEPGLFNGYADFDASRAEIAAINQAVTFLRSPRPSMSNLEEVRRLLHSYDAPSELLEIVDSGRAEREIVAEWLSRCHRLSVALVRNRKAEIGGFTQRIAHRIEVTPGNDQLKLQADLLGYIRKRYASADQNKRVSVGLVLVAFEKMLCSSSRALAGALESRAARLAGETASAEAVASDDSDTQEQTRRLERLDSADARVEASELLALARRARSIRDAKLDALDDLVLQVLAQSPDEKVLIFSQFLESIELIRERLSSRHHVGVFHGQMSRDEKEAAHQVFRTVGRVLVSSEAGGEGRNFQFCHVVVNYDLPWNPMKVEQRIGRVDRVGQTRDVEIYNFAVKGMLDERILDVLEYRIKIFTETVGALDPILESFEEEIGRIALGDRGDIDGAFGELDEEVGTEVRRAVALEELRRDFVLDWRSLQREQASRLLGRAPRATRDELEHFSRMVIARVGTAGNVEPHPDGGLRVVVPGRLREGGKDVLEDYRGSFDVTEALRDERMHFFAMGHPLVESIFDHVGDPWWSPVTVLESPDVTSDKAALLVDYRVELYGMRTSGNLISHLVTEEGVGPAVRLLKPTDRLLEVRVPDLSSELIGRFRSQSSLAAMREAAVQFEEFKNEHVAILEQEVERIVRMFDSRRGFLDDRIKRTKGQISSIQRHGLEHQKRIIPALRGQVDAAERRVRELEKERKERLRVVHGATPEFRLRLLAVTVVVPEGGLQELAT